MVFQVGFFAPMADRMEVEGERIRVGKQERRQLPHPPRKQLELLRSRRAIRVVGGKTFLGQDVQPGKQSQRFVAIEVVDVAQPLFVEQLQDEQAEQCVGGRNHLRAGIAGALDQAIKTQPRQEGPEQEYSRVPREQPPSGLQG